MPTSTASIAIGPQDELLRLTGNSTTPFETISSTGAGTGKYFGSNRTVRLRLAVSAVSGTSPTLDTKLQDSADGVTYADMGVSFSQVTEDQVDGPGTVTAAPVRTVNTADGRPWVRAHHTIGGSASPSVTAALLHEIPQPF